MDSRFRRLVSPVIETGERSRVDPSRPPPRDHDNNKADEFAKLGLVMEPRTHQ